MKAQQFIISGDTFNGQPLAFDFYPDLVFAFVSPQFGHPNLTEIYQSLYPNSIFTGCSTSGEIADVTVNDGKAILTAIQFEKTKTVFHQQSLSSAEDSFDAGAKLIDQFELTGLKHVFVLSDGLNVNGTKLVKGLKSKLSPDISITGGLAGDGADFKSTFVVDQKGQLSSNLVTAVGFYGDSLKIGYGSLGGWDSFGVDRLVTASSDNVLYEIDGKPALDLYKAYLVEQASELPAAGLKFPLSMRTNPEDKPVVRTILGVNEADKSLTFAGDIPEGSYVRLMKANIDRLLNGAEGAAEVSLKPLSEVSPDIAILISCVGRRLVLKQLVEEEVEAVREVMGDQTMMTGFYSYGEIAPFIAGASCELHNQTMTITTFREL